MLSLALAGCDVDVHERDGGKNVDLRSALGDVSVRTTEGGSATGLPVYPGARLLHDEDEEPASVDVSVASSYFGMQVAAAKFESDAEPRAIVDFYKDKLSAYGAVVECRGDIDFEGNPGRPVCKEEPAATEIQLVAGEREENHRRVAVKPRGTGSEFALVRVKVDERS